MVGFVINQQTLVRKEVSPARLHLISLNFALPAILEVALIARDGDVGRSHSNRDFTEYFLAGKNQVVFNLGHHFN